MENLQELHRKKRVVLPQVRSLHGKQKFGLSEDDTKKLEHLENILSDLNMNIHLSELDYIKENHGQEKLDLWIEKIKLRENPRTSDSESGKRLKFLDEQLKNITDYLNGL